MKTSIRTRSSLANGDPVRYTATFTADQIEKAKRLAQKNGHSVSQVIRNLVTQGLLCEGAVRETTESRFSGLTPVREIRVKYPMFTDPMMEGNDHEDDELLLGVASTVVDH